MNEQLHNNKVENGAPVPPPFKQPAAPPSKPKMSGKQKGCLWAVIVFVVLVAVGALAYDEDSAPKPATPTSQATATESASPADDAPQVPSTASAILAMDAPRTLVNDFADILPDSTERRMEDSLRALSNTTSNQITVLTVSDLEGEDPTLFAANVGDRWGVGQKKIDNGVVIVVKPKVNSEKGQVAIAPGRGLEGALPDVFCHRIIDDEMIPILKENNDYSEALWAALHVMMPVCRGEYSYETYSKMKDEEDSIGMWGWLCLALVFGPIIFLLVDIIFLKERFTKKWGITSGSKTGTQGDDDDNYHYSSSSSYDSGSDWGGFGGGSFSGGGASGSW
ncbi:MAG: TPM domain-containing protein [Sodaliphilus sp.]